MTRGFLYFLWGFTTPQLPEGKLMACQIHCFHKATSLNSLVKCIPHTRGCLTKFSFHFALRTLFVQIHQVTETSQWCSRGFYPIPSSKALWNCDAWSRICNLTSLRCHLLRIWEAKYLSTLCFWKMVFSIPQKTCGQDHLFVHLISWT